MNFNYKYRIYPTGDQLEMLRRLTRITRVIWSDSVRMVKEHFRANKSHSQAVKKDALSEIGKYWRGYRTAMIEQQDLTLIPPHYEYYFPCNDHTDFLIPDIVLLQSETISQIMKDLNLAYNAAFRRWWEIRKFDQRDKKGRPLSPGWPKRKKVGDEPGIYIRTRGKAAADYPGLQEIKDKHACFDMPNVGTLKIRLHRPMPPDAEITGYRVIKEARDEWYIVFNLKTNRHRDLPPLFEGMVGIDVGLVEVLALSDGQPGDYPHPHWYDEAQAKRRRLSRKADRQRRANNPDNFNEKGEVRKGVRLQWHISKRAEQTNRSIAKLEAHIGRQRRHYWQCGTDDLTRRYDVIVLEDFRGKVSFMKNLKRLTRFAADAGLGIFYQLLESKAAERGTTLVWVDPRYTSQTCSACGHVHKDNRKTRDIFECVVCGYVDHADFNAAKTILERGLEQMRVMG